MRQSLRKHSRLPRNGVSTFRWKRTTAVFIFLCVVFLFYSAAMSTVRSTIRTESAQEKEANVTKTEAKRQCIGEDATPKVALMFLATGKLHNEPTWRAFFEAAGRLCLLHRTPFDLVTGKDTGRKLQRTASVADSLYRGLFGGLSNQNSLRIGQRLDCSKEAVMIENEVRRMMTDHRDIYDLIDRQNLFSVYVNSIAYEEGEKSIFRRHVIPDAIDTNNGYAQFLPVKATLRMIHIALMEPRNRKFVLLSESCIPIQPPEVIHVQLLTEPRSRLNACRHGNRNLGRWNRKIVTQRYWRKSSQFFALRRNHAQLAADDVDLRRKFQQHCYTTWNPVTRLCVADEHFFATLVASKEQDNKTDCQGFVTSSEWNLHVDPWHPVSYSPEDVNAGLINRLARHGKALQTCPIDLARKTVGGIYGGFSTTACLERDFKPSPYVNSTLWSLRKGYHPLLYSCPLFARKFSADVAQKTLESALSCNGTGLGYWCY